MKTINAVRCSLASWIDAQVIADLRRAWHFANRADQALHERRKLIAFFLLAAHGYYLSRGDHRHDAAELIRPPTAGNTTHEPSRASSHVS